MASTNLSLTQSNSIDRAQRMAARQILGHRSTSPWPSPCLELGWQTWSSQMTSLKMRLYYRLHISTDPIIASLLAVGRTLPEGWVTATELQLSASFPAGPPTTASEWQQQLQLWEAAQRQADIEELLYNSRRHPNLAQYSPNVAAQPSGLDINHMIHHHSINDVSAMTISRLLCGGQGLNAGDPARPSEVCMRKACKYCLSHGQPVSETLWHFLHECPLTASARQSAEARECWAQPENVVKLHLSVWSYKQLRVIRGTLTRMWQLRQTFNRKLAKAQSSH